MNFFLDVTQQRKKFKEAMIDQTEKDLQIRLSTISAAGEFSIEFGEELLLPDNFSEIVKEREGKNDAVLGVTMVRPGNQLDSNLNYWSLISSSGEKLVIKLHFESLMNVSQDDEAD